MFMVFDDARDVLQLRPQLPDRQQWGLWSTKASAFFGIQYHPLFWNITRRRRRRRVASLF